MGAGLIGVGVVPEAVCIPKSPNTAFAMLAGRDKIVVIGDTAAGVLGAVMTAALLTCAVLTVDVLTAVPDAGDAVTASAVCAAIGISPDELSDEPARCAGPELPTACVGDAGCADESVFAVCEVPRPAATCTDRAAVSVAIDGVAGADVPVVFMPPELRTEADGPGLAP
jgi:hypothetical protein